MSFAVPEAPASVLRLAGASYWPGAGSALAHLLGLRHRLVRAAGARSVRVAVLHRAQWLLHWVEGPPGAVDMAWQRIQRMHELEGSRLLHRSLGPPLLREPLHIAGVFRNERSEHVARRIARFAEAGPEPAQIWNALAAPADVPPCGCVVLASARGHDDVDLLRRLAHRHGGEVVYRRFAGADPAQFDTGAAYADFPRPCGCSVRMHVLSRRCLRNELVLGELTDMRELVLLPGARPAAGRLLAQAAIDLVHACGGRPRIHLLAGEPANLAPAEELLRASAPDATVLARVVPTGMAEAGYLERALETVEGGEPGACPSWGRTAEPLAA